MNDRSGSAEGAAAAGAQAELGRLNVQVAAMRAVLLQLLQDVVRAEKRLDSSQATQLVEANQQLVVSALDFQAEAETSASWRPLKPQDLNPHDLSIAEHERRHAQLVEANEQLVLAALGFQELKAAADGSLHLRDKLLDAVAQELGDPLAPIRIAASLLGRANIHEDLLPRAQAIVEQQMDHMARMVGRLLEPAPGDKATILGHRVVDLCALATSAVAQCRLAIERRRQVLQVLIPPGPIGVRVEPAQIAQVLASLLDIATTYTPDGGRVSLSIEVVGALVTLIVSDNGMGLEPEALATVLEPFVRDPRAGADVEEGFGLGLTNVRAVLEAHGGSLVATSAGRGMGSQFAVSLPIVAMPGLANGPG